MSPLGSQGVSEVVRQHVPESVLAMGLGASEIEGWLLRAAESAQTQWPLVSVAPEVWAAWVLPKLVVEREPRRTLSDLRAEDLYLACACSVPSAQAAEAFDRYLAPEIHQALRKMHVDNPEAQDICATLRADLLFPGAGGASPGIERYSGRGTLRAWVRSAAIHTVLKRRRRGGRQVSLDAQDLALATDNSDPELGYLKTAYLREFKTAFAAAMKSLLPRERNLLRQRYVDGLSLDKVAGLYRVHRATMSRWLSEARGKLLSQTRVQLMDRLQISPEELDSIFRMAREASSFELSVERLLGAKARTR